MAGLLPLLYLGHDWTLESDLTKINVGKFINICYVEVLLANEEKNE